MNIDDLVGQMECSKATATVFRKYLEESKAKYENLDSYDLSNHLRRLDTEVDFFGESLRTLAATKVIVTILKERADN